MAKLVHNKKYKGRSIKIHKIPNLYFKGFGERGGRIGYRFYVNSVYIGEEPTKTRALKEAKKYINKWILTKKIRR